jgi:ATP-dependent Clp protease adaptor protein ClpS
MIRSSARSGLFLIFAGSGNQRIRDRGDDDAQTGTMPAQETKPVLALDSLWRVVMLDDPVNLQGYVVLVLRRVFGFDETRARKHMQEAHLTGRSVLWLGDREQAEAYVYSLQEWHLSAILEKDEAR